MAEWVLISEAQERLQEQEAAEAAAGAPTDAGRALAEAETMATVAEGGGTAVGALDRAAAVVTGKEQRDVQQVIMEVVDSERSYLASLEQLLRHFRPALQPLAPSLASAIFEGLGAIVTVSEVQRDPGDIWTLKSPESTSCISQELLGRLEAIPEVLLAADAVPDDPALLSWAVGALAASFMPHAVLSGAAAHPLRAYRAFVNHYEDTSARLAELGKVPSFAVRAKQVAPRCPRYP
jgi:hypothetical protein